MRGEALARLTRGQFVGAVTGMTSTPHDWGQWALQLIRLPFTAMSRYGLTTVGLCISVCHCIGATEPPHARQAARDDVFLQEIGRQVATADPLRALAVFGGKLYAGSDTGLYELNKEQLSRVAGVGDPVLRLV